MSGHADAGSRPARVLRRGLGGLQPLRPEGLGSEEPPQQDARAPPCSPLPSTSPSPRAQGTQHLFGVGADCPVVFGGLTWRTRKMIDLPKSGGCLLTEARLPPEHTARGLAFLRRETLVPPPGPPRPSQKRRVRGRAGRQLL